MKLIIDISEGDYAPFKFGKYIIVGGLRGNGKTLMSAVYKAIANATPLEKHDEEIITETVKSIWGKPPYTEMLDKIRAEIEKECEPCIYEVDFAYKHGLLRALEIIDKYNRKEQVDADSD